MRTLLAILLAGGGVATACVTAPSLRGTGAPTADPVPIICDYALVQRPETVAIIDGPIASAGVPTWVSGGTCVFGIAPLPPVVPSLTVSVPTPAPG